MCNAITHPPEKELKMVGGSMEKGRGERFVFEVLAEEDRKN